jgi:DUF1365 family protein
MLTNIDSNLIIFSVDSKGIEPNQLKHRRIVAECFLKELGLEFERIEGVYTYSDNLKWAELSFAVKNTDVETGKRIAWFAYTWQQESILVVNQNADAFTVSVDVKELQSQYIGKWCSITHAEACSLKAYNIFYNIEELQVRDIKTVIQPNGVTLCVK